MLEGLRDRPDAAADLILAADVMVYVADIAPVLREVERVLAPAGCSPSRSKRHAGEGVMLGEGLRYAHSAATCARRSAAAGLDAVAARRSLAPATRK